MRKRKKIARYLLHGTVYSALALVLVLLLLAHLDEAHAQARDEDLDRQIANEWLKNLRKGYASSTAFGAGLLVRRRPPAASKVYQRFADHEKVGAAFLSQDFCLADAQRWESAIRLKQLAEKITAGKANPVEALMLAVSGKVKAAEPRLQNAWPRDIWQRGYGLCDRQAWLICELAYQLGYETAIVYLKHPTTRVSPHTVAELRKGEQVWVVDSLSKKLIQGRGFDRIAADDKALLELWPDRKDWRVAAKGTILYIPAYPQDYCWRNQELHRKLLPTLGKDCPRFGDEPMERQKRYQQLRMAELGRKGFSLGLWNHPFRVLKEQIDASQKDDMKPTDSPIRVKQVP